MEPLYDVPESPVPNVSVARLLPRAIPDIVLLASCVLDTPADLIVTSPDVTVNDAVLNDAIPFTVSVANECVPVVEAVTRPYESVVSD